jgi:hypothetical protein
MRAMDEMDLRDQLTAELLMFLGHEEKCSAMWHTEGCGYCGEGLENLPHEYACDCLKRDALRIARGKERP